MYLFNKIVKEINLINKLEGLICPEEPDPEVAVKRVTHHFDYKQLYNDKLLKIDLDHSSDLVTLDKTFVTIN